MSCNSRQRFKAKVFERKQLDSHSIMIHYQYTVDEKNYIDSAILPDTAIFENTIDVVETGNNPPKAIPALLKK